MGFEIRETNGRFGMAAFCDFCGKHVVNGECNVLSQRAIGEGNHVPVKVACKVRCTDLLDIASELANQELGVCVLHLVNNSKIEIEEEAKTAQEMHEFFED